MAQGFRERIEQKAKKSLKDLRKASSTLDKVLGPLNKLVVHMIVDGKPMAEALEVAETLGQDLRGVLESLDQLRLQWGTGTSPGGASDHCADLLMKDLATTAEANVAEKAKPERGKAKGAAQSVLRGSSRCVPVATVLELLSTQSKSGTLRVSTDQEMFTFEMVSGSIVHTCTDRPPNDQLLGNILVERNVVSSELLDEFLARFGGSTELIGEALEREELVTKEQLREALEYQVQQRFNRMYTATESTYYFYEQAENVADDRLRMNVTQLLLESARSSDEVQRTEPEEAGSEEVWGAPTGPASFSPDSWNEPNPR